MGVGIVQSGIGGASPWSASGQVTSGNFVLVALSGAGFGTASISDSLGTSYSLIASATNSDAGGEKATTFLWGGFLTASGALILTVTGTFPVAVVDATGSNIGGQLYFVELSGVDATTPVRAYATNSTGSARDVSSTFSGVSAGAMLFMVAAQAYLGIDAWACASPSGFLHLSSGSSAMVAASAPTIGSYTIEVGAATFTPFFSSAAVVLNPSALSPIPATLSLIQSALDSAGSNPWVTSLTITAGNLLVVSLAGTHGGSASVADNLGTVYRLVDYYTGSASSAIAVWIGTATASGALTLTITGSFSVVSSTGYDAGGVLSVAEVQGSGGAVLNGFRISGNNTIGAGSTQAAWCLAGSLLMEVAAQGWSSVGAWGAVSPATFLQHVDGIVAVLSRSISADGPATIEATSTGTGPMISLVFCLGPAIVAPAGSSVTGTIGETAPVGLTQIDGRQLFPGLWETALVGITEIAGGSAYNGLIETAPVGQTEISGFTYINSPAIPGVTLAAVEVAIHREQGFAPPDLEVSLVAAEYAQHPDTTIEVYGVWVEVAYKPRSSVVKARYTKPIPGR